VRNVDKKFQMRVRMPRGRQKTAKNAQVITGRFRADREPSNPSLVPLVSRLSAEHCPPYVKGRARNLFVEICEQCYWLTPLDAHMVAVLANLIVEYERSPRKMQSARITQMRLLADAVGLLPGARTRMGVTAAPPPADDEDEEAARLEREMFND
jgi:hypothetical protein